MPVAASAAWRGPVLLIAAFVLLWQLLYMVTGDIAMRSPAATVEYTFSLLFEEGFGQHLEETAKAFGAALLIAIAIGLAVGMLLGFNRIAGDVAEPMLIAVYSIPKVTLYPIVLLAFGLGMSAKVAFGAIHGIIPIALFTINAVRNVKPILVKTGRVLKLDSIEMVTRILLPAALPEIFTGIRIGFALTLIGTLLGEMFASQRGLGYMLMNAIGLHDIDVIMAVTFLLIIFAAIVSSILLRIDHKLHRRF